MKYGLTNPSICTSTIVGNTTEYRPVDGVCYNDLRGDARAGTALPEVDTTDSGTFLQQLNCKTGNKFNFDLPTEVMYEIACRAGSSDKFYWGDTTDYSTYVVSSTSISPARTTTEEVGTKVANDWGLYDMVGNVYEWCLDDCSTGETPSTKLFTDPFIPYVNSSYTRARIKGIPYNQSSTSYMNPSYRNYGGFTFSTGVGFRVAYIAK